MQAVLLGASGTLTVAAIIAIVTLAFKDPQAYWKLCKVLMVLLGAALLCYGFYAAGSLDGGKSAVNQIKSGVATDKVETGMPGWPIAAASGIFAVLMTLSWFPEYLGIKGKNDGEKS
ncbi:membrane hypothetical protein [Mesorhizobium plurifarium]|uniref:Uncharacterized protein n=1 Tax=Mesorhizobium plurifarium TaxID=69974 RepID=A0A0K2W5X8_MESPL|nr:membrane hypothetical protein [Mesorhizobium plurifarium]